MRIIITLLIFSVSYAQTNSGWINNQFDLAAQRAQVLNINGTAYVPVASSGSMIPGCSNPFCSGGTNNNVLGQILGGGNLGGLNGLGGFGGGIQLPGKLGQILGILQIANTILNMVQTMFGGQQIAMQPGTVPPSNTGYQAGQGCPVTGNSNGTNFGAGNTISGALRYDTDGPGGSSASSTYQSTTSSRLDNGYFPHMTQHGAVAAIGSGGKVGDLVVVQQGGSSRVVPVTDMTKQTNSVNGQNYGTQIVEVSKHTYDDLGGSDARTSLTNTGVNVASGNTLNSETMARVNEVNNSLKANGGQATQSDLNYIKTGVRSNNNSSAIVCNPTGGSGAVS